MCEVLLGEKSSVNANWQLHQPLHRKKLNSLLLWDLWDNIY